MNPLALLALVPVLMLSAMFLYEATHEKRGPVRVRIDGRRVR